MTLDIPGYDNAPITVTFPDGLELVYSTDWLMKDKYDIKRHWQGHVLKDAAGTFYHSSTAYQYNAKGTKTKPITQKPTEVKIKNVGRSNQTTPESQAMSEIASKRKEQHDENYRPIGDDTPLKTLPMLADKYAARKSKVKFPCLGQVKMDGMRRIHGTHVVGSATGTTDHSRGGCDLSEEIIGHLRFEDTEGYELDGELILPVPYTFQTTMKACKKAHPELPPLEFVVYDVAAPYPYYTLDETMSRYDLIRDLVHRGPKHARVLEIRVLNNEEELEEFFAEVVTDKTLPDGTFVKGGEGIILRPIGGTEGYRDDKRVDQILKLKKEDDQEYRVVAVEPGKRGEAADQAMFICETEEGRRFNVTPKLTHERRREILKNPDEVVGTIWKVAFHEYTDKSEDGQGGLPRHGRAISMRDVALEGKGSIS